MRKERWNDPGLKDRDKYAHIVPDIVIEIVSTSDSYAQQVAKTKAWCATYAVVIDPVTRRHEHFGDAPTGFALDVDRIIDAGV